jgi:hypothetical protein
VRGLKVNCGPQGTLGSHSTLLISFPPWTLIKFAENKMLMHSSGPLRSKLHQYIDAADEQKLQAIYKLFENEIEKGPPYNKEEIELFYERRRRHFAGEGKSYSVEESINRIKLNSKA